MYKINRVLLIVVKASHASIHRIMSHIDMRDNGTCDDVVGKRDLPTLDSRIQEEIFKNLGVDISNGSYDKDVLMKYMDLLIAKENKELERIKENNINRFDKLIDKIKSNDTIDDKLLSNLCKLIDVSIPKTTEENKDSNNNNNSNNSNNNNNYNSNNNNIPTLNNPQIYTNVPAQYKFPFFQQHAHLMQRYPVQSFSNQNTLQNAVQLQPPFMLMPQSQSQNVPNLSSDIRISKSTLGTPASPGIRSPTRGHRKSKSASIFSVPIRSPRVPHHTGTGTMSLMAHSRKNSSGGGKIGKMTLQLNSPSKSVNFLIHTPKDPPPT